MDKDIIAGRFVPTGDVNSAVLGDIVFNSAHIVGKTFVVSMFGWSY